MKTRKLLAFLFPITILTSCGLDTSVKGSTSITSTKTQVENVQLKKEYPNAWGVTGMIRNNSSSEIRGAVKIKFLNSRGDVVYNSRAKVNDDDPLKPGQAGNFEYFTDPDNFDGVTDFDVEFYER